MEAAVAQLMRERPQLPEALKKPTVVRGDRLPVGTIDEVLTPEEAEEFFSKPDPYERARRSAAEKLGRITL